MPQDGLWAAEVGSRADAGMIRRAMDNTIAAAQRDKLLPEGESAPAALLATMADRLDGLRAAVGVQATYAETATLKELHALMVTLGLVGEAARQGPAVVQDDPVRRLALLVDGSADAV